LFAVKLEEITYLVMLVPEGMVVLHKQFKDEPMYLQVIDTLTELDFGVSEHERKRARHRASQDFIEEGRLWQLGGGAGV
jgi:hypothetical protein